MCRCMCKKVRALAAEAKSHGSSNRKPLQPANYQAGAMLSQSEGTLCFLLARRPKVLNYNDSDTGHHC